MPVKEQHMMDELNFERYHDLVEAERLKGNKNNNNNNNFLCRSREEKILIHLSNYITAVSERERLNEVEEEWTKLLERHKALLAMLNNSK